MSDASPHANVIREWVAKAENDLKNAANTLKMGKGCPTDTVGFHVQQCVEKYLKALLVCQSISFPKTHNLRALMALIPEVLRPDLPQPSQDRLTEYATVMRYPDAGPDPTLAEVRKEVALARRVRKEIRKHLPKAALRQRKK